jgi:hypothetical protein
MAGNEHAPKRGEKLTRAKMTENEHARKMAGNEHARKMAGNVHVLKYGWQV